MKKLWQKQNRGADKRRGGGGGGGGGTKKGCENFLTKFGCENSQSIFFLKYIFLNI